jgi:hypothetical protein
MSLMEDVKRKSKMVGWTENVAVATAAELREREKTNARQGNASCFHQPATSQLFSVKFGVRLRKQHLISQMRRKYSHRSISCPL